MNKLMNVLFGAEMHASAKDIRGKKSSGVEDIDGFNHWRSTRPEDTFNDYGEN